ncbi:oligosaccharide flippase family protein, partial [Escherichia albertii]|nr:oligosaccharide flippase family protein [Escherichia albertii]
ITKLSSLFFIYFLVDSPSDIYTLAWIYSLQALSVAFLLLSIVVIKYRIKIVVCSVDEVKKLLISSFPFFLSRVSASLYSSVCSIFLGYYSTSQVALYNAAEQLYKAGQQVFWPLNQALYPYMIRTKDYFVFIKIVFAAVIVSLFGVFVGIAYGADLLSIIFGAEFKNASDILSIFMLAILVNTIGSLIGYPALAPLGLSNIANKSVIYAGCVQILLLLFIGRYVDYIDGVIVAITVVVCELVVAFYRGKYLFEYGRKRGI